MDLPSNVNRYADREELSLALTDHVARLAAKASVASHHFSIALSGGSLMDIIGPTLGSTSMRGTIDWSSWHVFWVDERWVPWSSPDSNYGLAKRRLFSRVGIPSGQVHATDDSLSPSDTARAYESTLATVFQLGAGQVPRFDLVLLGIGEDGHTASLFPGHPVLLETTRLFQKICAHTDEGEPCCDWVGEGGAGHFVKMVHNGIEYGDMQLIGETYQMMKVGLGMSNAQMRAVFAQWNRGVLDSYLIEITRDILGFRNPGGEAELDKILDTAGQKGTGKWAATNALDLGQPLTLIGEAVFARCLSALKEERVAAAQAGWRRVAATAVRLGIPLPAIGSALAYYDGYRSARLPANLLQAQRDYFGAHTYERIDRPRGEFFHTNWTGHGGATASSTYDV